VAHPDGAGETFVTHLDELLPQLRRARAAGRPVDQPQVHLVGAEGLEARVERLARPPGPPRRQLGGDEDVLARHPAVGDGPADLALVLVYRGRVDVPVADLERGADRLVGLLTGDLPGAEAEHRDLDTTGQR